MAHKRSLSLRIRKQLTKSRTTPRGSRERQNVARALKFFKVKTKRAPGKSLALSESRISKARVKI